VDNNRRKLSEIDMGKLKQWDNETQNTIATDQIKKNIQEIKELLETTHLLSEVSTQ
jgi:hypothetical protein